MAGGNSSFSSTRKLAAARSHEFDLVSGFKHGYRNREDVTTLPPGILIPGSQNVLTNTNQRTSIRKGYTLDGAANSDLAPIASSFDWETSAGEEMNMRSGFLTSAGNDGKLQFRSVASDGTVTWTDLMTGLSNVNFNYTTWWNDSTLLTEVLFVNGTSNIFEWNGATVTVSSAANPTGIVAEIEKAGDNSQILVSGGKDYTVGDVLTLSGGGNNATIRVNTITTGAINGNAVNAGGSGYVIGNQFQVSGGTGGLFRAIGQVATVDGGGGVLTYTLLGYGTGYSAASGVATTNLSGSGTGFTINISSTSGGAVATWGFTSDANHGTGYALNTTYNLTGGTGSGAHLYTDRIVTGTITKTGTDSWAQSGFAFGSGTRTLSINGTIYTYDAIDFIGDTTTLYGVTPDPSAIPASAVVIQGVNTYANGSDLANLPTDYKQDLISSLNQRVFLGQSAAVGTQKNGGKVFVSKFNDFTTYGTLKIAGVVGSAFEIFTTSPPTAFIPQEQYMYISAGTDQWYNVSFSLSSDLLDEIISINRLNTTGQQSSQAQACTSKIANDIIFLSHEPIIQSFGRIPNILQNTTPQMTDLSSPIVNDLNGYNLTNAAITYHRKFVYVAVPAEGKVLVYNMTDIKNPYWEAPQVLPIGRFSIIGGELYGHSSEVSETYQLFTGTADRVTPTSQGQPIEAIWNFSYENYGSRFSLKKATKMYVEGYINANTTLTAKITYELDGCKIVKTFTLDGSDSQFVCIGTDESSLGKVSLGKVKLGGDKAAVIQNLPPKFRWFPTFNNTDFFEVSVSFSIIGLNDQMELLAFGLAASGSSEIPVKKYD